MSHSTRENFKYENILSIKDNNLIIYKKDIHGTIIKTYVCEKCIDSKSKKTKRLAYAIKNENSLSIEINDVSSDFIEVRIKNQLNTLYDDDVYVLNDLDNLIEIKLDSQSNNKIDKPLFFVYVLELEQSKYYVGKSVKPLARTGEHLAVSALDSKLLTGSGWTGLYQPIRILEINPAYDEFDEDRYTLRYMKNKGIDNVRGGSFCELNLSRENIVTLEKMLAGAEDKCYYCGIEGHFINNCPQKSYKRVLKRKKPQLKVKNVPKSKILKFYGTTKLLQNSNIDVINQTQLQPDNQSQIKTYSCKYCHKTFTSLTKKTDHENVICEKSDKVMKGKMIEADVDSILEKNKKYFKN